MANHPPLILTTPVYAVSPATNRLQGRWPYGNQPGIFSTALQLQQSSFSLTTAVPVGNTYVASPTGSNSNTGSAGSPWAFTPSTWAATVSKLAPNDTLLLRGGTYNVTYDGTPRLVTPTVAGSPVVVDGVLPAGWRSITNYPGETATFLVDNVASGWGFNLSGSSYLCFKNLSMQCVDRGFSFPGSGNNGGYSGTGICHNLIFWGITGTQSSAGQDNSGIIYCGDQAQDTNHGPFYIWGCNLQNTSSTLSGVANMALIFAGYNRQLHIVGNALSGSNAPIYYKYPHTALTSSAVDISIRNNVIACSLAAALSRGTLSEAAFAIWKNNLFLGTGSDNGYGGVTNEVGVTSSTAIPSAAYAQWIHNTFVGAGFGDGNYHQASIGVTLRDNIFVKPPAFFLGGSSSANPVLTSNYNLLPSGTAVTYGSGYTNYTLAQWRALFAGYDLNSIAGSPTFVGVPSFASPALAALASGSLGVGAASDGTDMGVNVSNLLTMAA